MASHCWYEGIHPLITQALRNLPRNYEFDTWTKPWKWWEHSLVQLLSLLWLFFPCPNSFLSLFSFPYFPLCRKMLLYLGVIASWWYCWKHSTGEVTEWIEQLHGWCKFARSRKKASLNVPPAVTCNLIPHQRHIFCLAVLFGHVNVFWALFFLIESRIEYQQWQHLSLASSNWFIPPPQKAQLLLSLIMSKRLSDKGPFSIKAFYC